MGLFLSPLGLGPGWCRGAAGPVGAAKTVGAYSRPGPWLHQRQISDASMLNAKLADQAPGPSSPSPDTVEAPGRGAWSWEQGLLLLGLRPTCTNSRVPPSLWVRPPRSFPVSVLWVRHTHPSADKGLGQRAGEQCGQLGTSHPPRWEAQEQRRQQRGPAGWGSEPLGLDSKAEGERTGAGGQAGWTVPLGEDKVAPRAALFFQTRRT